MSVRQILRRNEERVTLLRSRYIEPAGLAVSRSPDAIARKGAVRFSFISPSNSATMGTKARNAQRGEATMPSEQGSREAVDLAVKSQAGPELPLTDIRDRDSKSQVAPGLP